MTLSLELLESKTNRTRAVTPNGYDMLLGILNGLNRPDGYLMHLMFSVDLY